MSWQDGYPKARSEAMSQLTPSLSEPNGSVVPRCGGHARAEQLDGNLRIVTSRRIPVLPEPLAASGTVFVSLSVQTRQRPLLDLL
jgi:hypothetical protein